MTEQQRKGGRRKGEGGSEGKISLLPTSIEYLIAAALAIGLCWIFWTPLWQGGSLIGGDLFPYFFPQKVFLAERLQAGEIPLWNPLTGQGYPTIAESQTGVCYPPDLIAYFFLPVTPAYNVVQIVHYIFAFVGMWLFAKRVGCQTGGALLAALSFVYGWFPPRICLEWAIVTGAYLPWILWCAESFYQRRQWRYLVGLAVLATLQLLAGHFHVAFMTELTLAIYAPLRAAIGSVSLRSTSDSKTDNPQAGRNFHWLLIWLAVAVSFPLAAVQLAPTWELKQRSQRSDVSKEHLPGYGHLPPRYWTQVVMPWHWYSTDIDQELQKLPNYSGGADTNKVEAHLYFGSLPLLLAIGGLIISWRSRSEQDRLLRLWALIGLAFLLYTPGWLLPITQHLPGFSFFRGPGRYGIITSLAVALIAGVSFDRLTARFPERLRTPATLVVLAVTSMELWWVAQSVGYSLLLHDQVVEQRVASPLRKLFADDSQPDRLFAPMANVANLLDVSSLPVYLGIGPEEYFDPKYTMPTDPKIGFDPSGRPDQIAWLQQAGVTHILSLEKLPPQKWPVDLQWTGFDPVFNRALGRPQEPVYLYRLRDSRGRIAWEQPPADAASQAEIVDYRPHRVAARCDSANGGRLILTDLAYPGWKVEIDGQPAAAETSGMFRAVTVPPGVHEVVWSYRPASVYWGAILSAGTLLMVVIGSLFLTRRNRADVSH